MVNRLSNMEMGRMPSEFSVTPMQNVPARTDKEQGLHGRVPRRVPVAVYYASTGTSPRWPVQERLIVQHKPIFRTGGQPHVDLRGLRLEAFNGFRRVFRSLFWPFGRGRFRLCVFPNGN